MSEDDPTDGGRSGSRGRQPAQRPIGPQSNEPRDNAAPFLTRQDSTQSVSSGSRRSSPTRHKPYERRTFTRSRSPAVLPPERTGNGVNRPSSPSLFSRHRNAQMVAIRSLFPSTVCITFRLLLLRGLCTASFDTRQALENIILLCSVGYGAVKIRGFATGPFDADMWMSIGTALLPLVPLYAVS